MSESIKNHVQELARKCVEKWGIEDQLLMIAEECSELAKEILHYRRKSKANKRKLIEEFVDVEFMLEQFKVIFDNPDDLLIFLSMRRKKLRYVEDKYLNSR